MALFRANWNLLVTSNHNCQFALPFLHLTSDKFWKLVPRQGFENIMQFKTTMRSFANLNAAIDFAVIEEDLFLLMKETASINILKQVLLETYFPETRNNFSYSAGGQRNIFNEIEGKILNEDADEYRNEIKELMQQNDEEEIFLRGSLFKREIPRIYKQTCCISGMKIDATISVSMIDACHIVPFSESFDDTITNGLALCPNLHRAFDRGLIDVDENFKVTVSKLFREKESDYSIRKFEGKEILLPDQAKYFPLKENLGWHNQNIFKS